VVDWGGSGLRVVTEIGVGAVEHLFGGGLLAIRALREGCFTQPFL
jgi:hypothetical protein